MEGARRVFWPMSKGCRGRWDIGIGKGRFAPYCAGLLGTEGRRGRGAAGGGDSAVAGVRAASVVAPFRRAVGVVGRSRAGRGARLCPAGDGAARSDRGIEDPRRHELSQAGPAFGRGRAAILRAAWQAGQLPGRGDAFARQSSRQPAGRLSPPPAEGMGRGPASPQAGGSSRRCRFRDQDGDRARLARAGPGARPPAGLCADGRGLRVGYGVSRGGDGAWPALRHGRRADDQRLRVQPGVRPLAQTKPRRGKGPPALLRLRRDDERKPVYSVKELALNLPAPAWQVIEWREGSNDVLKGRFARVRVHAAHRNNMSLKLAPRNG